MARRAGDQWLARGPRLGHGTADPFNRGLAGIVADGDVRGYARRGQFAGVGDGQLTPGGLLRIRGEPRRAGIAGVAIASDWPHQGERRAILHC